MVWHPRRDPDPEPGAGAGSETVLVEFVEAARVGSGGVLEFLVQIVVVVVVWEIEVVGGGAGVGGGGGVGVGFVGAFFHGVHGFEVDPGGGRSGGGVVDEAREGEGAEALDFGAVPFAEFFHFVAALDGSFGSGGSVGALGGDGVGDLLPVGGFEVGTAEGVPLVAVGVDEGGGFLRGPAGRGEAAGGGGGRGGEREGNRGGGVGISGRRWGSHGGEEEKKGSVD